MEIGLSIQIGQPATGNTAHKGISRELILRQQNYLLTKYFRGDPLNLSQRITQLRFQDAVAESLRISMKNVDSLNALTNEISQYSNEQDIAKWVRDIEKQARKVIADGDTELMNEFKGIVSSAKDEILDGLEYNDLSKLDKAYFKVFKAAEKLNGAGLDIAVENALEKKALSNAFRIAHTEIRRAYTTGVYTRGLQDEDVDAFQIELSAAGNNCDECVELAEMDNGAGPGVFPADEVPIIPQHPHCRCELSPVYSLPRGVSKNDIETDYDGDLMEGLPNNLVD